MRELALRTLYGAVYLAVILAALLNGWAFAVVGAAATIILLDEFFRNPYKETGKHHQVRIKFFNLIQKSLVELSSVRIILG